MVRMKTILRFRSFGIGLTLAGLVSTACLAQTSPGHTQGSAPASTAKRKLITLTFDDGPKPYVLMGRKSPEGVSYPSLLSLLDHENVKATFFVWDSAWLIPQTNSADKSM